MDPGCRHGSVGAGHASKWPLAAPAKQLKKQDFKNEIETSVTNGLGRSTFVAIFFVGYLAAIEFLSISSQDV